MIQRCTNKNCLRYPRYGGRGIRVCQRWRKAANFLTDMGYRRKKEVLDRIDNDGNYTPRNCRWATRSQSARNICGSKLSQKQVVRIRELLLRHSQADVMRKFGISRSHICNIANGVRWP